MTTALANRAAREVFASTNASSWPVDSIHRMRLISADRDVRTEAAPRSAIESLDLALDRWENEGGGLAPSPHTFIS